MGLARPRSRIGVSLPLTDRPDPPGGIARPRSGRHGVNLAASRAIQQPTPRLFQKTVKTGILSLVWLNVGLVAAVRGPEPPRSSPRSGSRLRPGPLALLDMTPCLRIVARGTNPGIPTHAARLQHNGLAHHRVLDAIELLADEGYQSVGNHVGRGCTRPVRGPRNPGHVKSGRFGLRSTATVSPG